MKLENICFGQLLLSFSRHFAKRTGIFQTLLPTNTHVGKSGLILLSVAQFVAQARIEMVTTPGTESILLFCIMGVTLPLQLVGLLWSGCSQGVFLEPPEHP